MALNLSSLTPQEQIATLFIAYFDRAPAPSGLDYWSGKLISGEMTIGEIATSFGRQLETIGLYPELGAPNAATPASNLALVTDVFQNLFGRDPANGPDNYYVQQLNAGADIGKIIVQIANGAVGADKELLENKIEVGLDWASDALIANIATTTNPLSAVVDGQLVILDQEAYDNARSVLDGVTADDATVDAAKAATDAFIAGYGQVDPVDPVSETLVLTEGTDVLTGGEGDDEFLGNQDTTDTSDVLDGAGGDDTLVVSVQTGAGDVFTAPTLRNIETVEVNGPNLAPGQDITMDLSNASGYEILRSFQTTADSNGISLFTLNPALVSFLDIQNANETNLEIIDTNADHLFTYDANSMTLFGGDDDTAEIKLQEVDGSTITLRMETAVPGTPGGDFRSHIDRVEITSVVRPGQVSATTNNLVQKLNVGPVFNDLEVFGDADLEIEKFLDEAVNNVDASALEAGVTLDLIGQGVEVPFIPPSRFGETPFDIVGDLDVLGGTGDNRIDVRGNTNGTFVFQGGDDELRVGNASDEIYVREDVFGNLRGEPVDQDSDPALRGDFEAGVIMGDGEDEAILNITGEQVVDLGGGHDSLLINGNVDDLSTRVFNDGISEVLAGEGDDDVVINGQSVFGIPVEDLDNDYLIDLGGGHDSLEVNSGGDLNVLGGGGEDSITVNGNGDQVIDSGADNDTVNINGDGVHDVALGGGNDSLTIIGSRLPDNNIDNAIEDRQTTIDGGDGDDTVLVDGDHYLLASLGLGADSIELNTDELTVDDIIYGNREDEDDTEIDTLILNNDSGNIFTGHVGRSETSSISGIDVYDLRDTNITLLLSSDNFDTAVDGDILVKTTESNSLPLPLVFGEDVLFQGMTRAEYEDVADRFFSRDGTSTQDEVEALNDYLFNNTRGLDSINFFDGDASDDAQSITGIGQSYGGDTGGPADDSVDFQGAPDGKMVVDITNIPMSVVSGRNFELQGGNIRDVVIADDASISSRLILDYDASKSTLHSIEDTLQVIDGAHISAADLRNTEGLEIIELLSAENDGQTWVVELTDRVINQTTSNADLIIRVGPDVPAGSEVIVEVDPSVYSNTATKNVVIETVSNAQVYIDMKDGNGPQLVGQPLWGTDLLGNAGIVHPTGATITVEPRLLFTQNADDLIGTDGDDTFIFDSISQLSSADSADGGKGYDTVLADGVAVANQAEDLYDQLGRPALTRIEEIAFDTGNNVQMTSLDGTKGPITEPLENMLLALRTGSGNDTLRQMEAIGDTWSEGYFLDGGDDFFSSNDGNAPGSRDNNYSSDDYYADGGAGDDTAEVHEDQELFATDFEDIFLRDDADVTVRTIVGSDDGEIRIVGNEQSDFNDVDLNGFLNAAAGGTAIVSATDVRSVDDVSGASHTIIVNNDETGGPDGDLRVRLDDGDDSLTVTNVIDLDVFAEAGTKTVDVGASGSLTNPSVEFFDYRGGTGIDGGVDNIVARVDETADIRTGDLDDNINVSVEQGEFGGPTTTPPSAGQTEIYVDAGDGDDIITASLGRGVGEMVLIGGDGADTFNVTTLFGSIASIDTGLGADGVGDTVNLYAPTTAADPQMGIDTIVFGDIVYDNTQNVDTNNTTQNFLAKGFIAPFADIAGVSDSIDTINNFNAEGGIFGIEDIFDFSNFVADDFGGFNPLIDLVWADWTGGRTNVDLEDTAGPEDAEIAVIAVNNGFELSAADIVSGPGTEGAIGIEMEDGPLGLPSLGDRAVAITVYDTNGDGGFDAADIYYIQDVDSDLGEVWAVDKVATVNFATQVGLTSIDNLFDDNVIIG